MSTSASRTVVVALVANVGVAIAKVAAAVITASTAMTAEASHACADVGNQLLLVVRELDSSLRAQSAYVHRVDIVPSGPPVTSVLT